MDKIIKTLICGGQVSLTVLETTDLVNRAVQIHGLSPRAGMLLGGLLTCGAYVASSLKEDRGSISITVKAKCGDGAVSVSADKELHIRGYADGTCEDTLVGGALTVVREDGFSTPFTGACEILSDNVSDILETYYGQSEQIPTAVYINVEPDDNGGCLAAYGVVMQLLPDARQDKIEEAGGLFEEFKCHNTLSDAQEIFSKFFAEYSSGEVGTGFPEYRCNCSEKKISGVLASVGKAELLKICDELGEVKVHCHYCNKDYIYDRARIEELF